jgi:hypothetical protein
MKNRIPNPVARAKGVSRTSPACHIESHIGMQAATSTCANLGGMDDHEEMI